MNTVQVQCSVARKITVVLVPQPMYDLIDCECMFTTGLSLASQHEAAVNDAQQIWPPLMATCGHFSWARLGWQSVTSHSSAVMFGRRQSRIFNTCL